MTKVKIQRPPANNPNKLSRIFIATIASIILLILVKIFTRESPEPVTKSGSGGQSRQSGPQVNTAPAVENPYKALKEEGVPIQKITTLYLKKSGFNMDLYKHGLSQKKLLEDFKAKIHLDMPFPPGLNYLDLDLDERVAGVIGTSIDGKKTFAVLATDQKVTADTAIAYLEESTDSFGFLKNHKFDTEKQLTFPSPPASGLKPLTIVPSSDHKGLGLYMALAERKDGKGSYLFMMEAPKKEFDENEDGLDLMLNMVKVRP